MDPTTTVIKLSGFPVKVQNVPPVWPLEPSPDKISLLFNANYHNIYHQFSPYTNYQDNLLSSVLSDKQPFIYTFIDEKDKGLISQLPDTVKALASAVNITQGTVNDVLRISKYMISSWGVQWVGTQFALQRLQPFDETRLYNPLSPILATVSPLTLGLGQPPTRHIEGGLVGLANSLTSTIGINLQSGFQKPASTAGTAAVALPTANTGQGKGMIRGADATRGLTSFQSKWKPTVGPSNLSLGSALNNFGQSVKQAFTSFFGSPTKSPGQVRADEEGYSIMRSGATDLHQGWFAPVATKIGGPPAQNKSTLGSIASSANAVFSTAQAVISNPVGSIGGAALNALFPSTAGGSGPVIRFKLVSFPDKFDYVPITSGLTGPPIGAKTTGYTISGDKKYGEVIGKVSGDSLNNSDMLVQFGYYNQENRDYPTKFSDAEKATQLKNELQKVISKLNGVASYNIAKAPASYLLPAAGVDADYVAYGNWTKKQQNAQKIGTLGEYQEGSGASGTRAKSVDAGVRAAPDNLRMATTFLSDGINMLGVLPKNRSTQNSDGTSDNLNRVYPNWKIWEPEDDDLIAFYFYDVVNSKYIPFRATVKGISEGNTAFWDELRFIGRSDQLYSYNGFSRTLSFTFNIVVGSVTELLPCWKKINYIASAVKPSNYTYGQSSDDKYSRFIVPPMFMLTIGDLYKYQPVVITSINVNIPDDAAWETLNENNSKLGWSYLNGTITSPNLGKNYGQLPREVEIAITCNLLEKERAIVGGSHFGHEPRVDDWEKYGKDNPSSFAVSGSSGVPYLPAITELHKKFVEWNEAGLPNPSTPNSAVTQQRIDQPTAAPINILSAPPPPLYQMPTQAGVTLTAPAVYSLSNTNNVALPFNPGNPISSNFAGGGGSFGGAGAGGRF